MTDLATMHEALARITNMTDQFGEHPCYEVHVIARTAIDPPCGQSASATPLFGRSAEPPPA